MTEQLNFTIYQFVPLQLTSANQWHSKKYECKNEKETDYAQ